MSIECCLVIHVKHFEFNLSLDKVAVPMVAREGSHSFSAVNHIGVNNVRELQTFLSFFFAHMHSRSYWLQSKIGQNSF